MAKYRVVKAPMGFLNSRGAGVTGLRAGVVVEVDDDQAAGLVETGHLERVTRVEGKTGTVLDGVVDNFVGNVLDPVEKPKADAPASRPSAKAKPEA